ncbi:MAG TPA: type IV pilus assembly protein PilM [Verrucomicrobiales bacterium]|nr:type IV pilus assembly protein PilM [Verrucomicrobiales bacterium]
MATKPASVALNIGSQRVSLASFAGGGGSLVLKVYEVRELSGDPSSDVTRTPLVKEAVGQLVGATRARGQQARYAISSQPVFTRFVKLPPLSEDKVEQIVAFEAQQNVPFPLDEVVWGYQLIGEPGSGEVEVLLGAIKSDELNAINDAVEGAGLNAVSADIAPMLVYNAFRYNYPDVFDCVLLVDIGSRTTDLIYIEGQKVFISTSRIGGSNITSAIAKELDTTFEQAEQLKLAYGQVAPGGAHAPPEDPQAAAIGNVARSTLTRLHGEIVRSNSRYKSQQGGNSPVKIFLAGGGASMPGIGEFFAEKFGLPVEFFNAMRNVAVGPKVNTDVVASEAHRMGEMVGLALRNREGSPIELELVPESLSRARDLEKRKPALILALVALLGAMAAMAFFFYQAKSKTEARTVEIAAEVADLDVVAQRIRKLDERLETVQAEVHPFQQTLNDRVLWINVLNDINASLPSDQIWLTLLAPTVDKKDFTKPIVKDGLTAPLTVPEVGAATTTGARPTPRPRPAAGAPEAAESPSGIGGLFVRGLFHENPAGNKVVFDFLDSLKAKSVFFDVKDKEARDLGVVTDTPAAQDRWAWSFQMDLPLIKNIDIK